MRSTQKLAALIVAVYSRANWITATSYTYSYVCFDASFFVLGLFPASCVDFTSLSTKPFSLPMHAQLGSESVNLPIDRVYSSSHACSSFYFFLATLSSAPALFSALYTIRSVDTAKSEPSKVPLK